jgi:hypothetical protein
MTFACNWKSVNVSSNKGGFISIISIFVSNNMNPIESVLMEIAIV